MTKSKSRNHWKLRTYEKSTCSSALATGVICQLMLTRSENFAGEIMAFGAMSGQDIDRIIQALVSFGYIGPDQGGKSDMVLSAMWGGSSYIPDWIEPVDVCFFDETKPPVQAWKMKKSGVYDLINFEADLSLPRKGYQCGWPPLIGEIS